MSERSFYISENVVICLDCSRSMFRTDYRPNRFQCGINALKLLIKERFEIDDKTTFAIVKFSDKAEKVSDFTNYANILHDALDSITIGGRSNLGEALAKAIKIIVVELRKIAAKIPRILVVSDGNYTSSAIDPIKMARIAYGLKIKVDTLKLGELSDLNILKRLSDLTKGCYYYNNDVRSLNESARSFAKANVKKYTPKFESMIENPAFLRKIAANLLKVKDLTKDQEMQLKQIRGKTDFKKCIICFSETDPITKGSFYHTGRFCPNCHTPFHIHCLVGWASSQSDSKLVESGTCRCPHCFYLLKIPIEVVKLQKLTTFKTKKQMDLEKSDVIPATIENISTLGDEALYNSCPVCNLIFEENQEVVKCGNYPGCVALYHIECFQRLDYGRCKICGSKLKLQ